MRYAHISAGDGTASTQRLVEARMHAWISSSTRTYARRACTRACAKITPAARLAGRDTIVLRFSLLARIARRISRAVRKAWRGVTNCIQVPCDKGCCCANARCGSATLVYALLGFMILRALLNWISVTKLKREKISASDFFDENIYTCFSFCMYACILLIMARDFSKKTNNNYIFDKTTSST